MTINGIHLIALAVSIGPGIWLILHFKSQISGPQTNNHLQARSVLERFASIAFITVWLVVWSAAILVAGTISFVIAKLNPSIVSVLVLLFLGTWLTAAIAGWFAAVTQFITALLGRRIPHLRIRFRIR